MISRRFADRADAGRKLAEALEHLRGEDVVVLGLARGGVVVAHEVSRALDAPLEVVVARKLGAPLQPELAIGAVADGGTVLRDDVVEMLGISDDEVAEIIERERRRAAELERRFRHERPEQDVEGRTVVLVDDGLATGATALAAIRALRDRRPRRIVLAVPVAPPETIDSMRGEVDEIVAPMQPQDMRAVGLWYERFDQVEDAEVEAMLDERAPAGGAAHQPAGRHR